MGARFAAAFLLASLLGSASARAAEGDKPTEQTPPAPKKKEPRRRIEQNPGQAFLFAKKKLTDTPGAEPVVKIMEIGEEQIVKDPDKADQIAQQQLGAVNHIAEQVQQQPQTPIPPET